MYLNRTIQRFHMLTYKHKWIRMHIAGNAFVIAALLVGLLSTTKLIEFRAWGQEEFTLARLFHTVPAVSAQSTGPGGVNTSLELWLRADAGTDSTIDGDPVSQWNDQSGQDNNGTNGTAAQQPLYRNNATDNVNFNPVLQFDGSNDRLNLPDGTAPAGTGSYLIIGVGRAPASSASAFYGGGSATTDRGFNVGLNSNGRLSHGWTNQNFNTADNIRPDDLPIIGGYHYRNTVGRQTFMDGELLESDTRTSANIANSNHRVGVTRANTQYFNGEMSELIAFADELTLAETQRIYSYLAIKYGITLSSDNNGDATAFEAPNADAIHEGDYVASNGTIVWDASANSLYHNNVAGIGRDADSRLDQRISRSILAGSIVTVASDNDFSSANTDSSRTSLNNGAFLIWGNNGLDATTWVSNTVASGAPPGKERLTREWLVQQTGSVGGVSLQVNVDDPDVDLPEVGGILYLLVDVDRDGEFGDETAQTMAAQGGGLYTISGINLSNGQRFTFATPNSGIRGSVFHDDNANGQQEKGEEGLENITVTAVDARGFTASTTTDASGAYLFLPDSGIQGSTRITFSLPSAAGSLVTATSIFAQGDDSTLQPTVFGRDTKTDVNFVHVGSGWTIVNAGFALKDRPTPCTNPTVVTTCYENGQGSSQTGLLSFPFNDGPDNYNADATTGSMGAVYGSAHDPAAGALYTAALLKRHAGLGTLAAYNGSDTYTVDGVYAVPFSNGVSAYNPATPGFTLQGVTPANGGPSIDLGTVQRHPDNNGTLDDGFELMASGVSLDQDAFEKVGTVGFGNADVFNGDLWLVNANQRTLIQVDTAGLPTDGSAAPAGNVTQHAIADPGCSNGDMRPWALTFYNGLGYVGLVCSAETTQSASDLHAYILSFDPSSVAGSFVPVLGFPLDFSRERAMLGSNIRGWQPWTRTIADMTISYRKITSYPQPILADIDFKDDGDMLIGFMDRWGLQTTVSDPHPITGQQSKFTVTAGDLMLACATGSNTWAIEGDTGCQGFQEPSGLQRLTNDGPFAAGEFFFADTHMRCHGGSLTYEDLVGSACAVGDTVLATNYGTYSEGGTLFLAGLRRFNATTGRTQGFHILPTSLPCHTSAVQSRASLNNALGELVCMCPGLPVEIGNRIWIDYDLDGQQDPDEPPIAGVTVELVSSSSVIATATTNASGEYYFSSDSGTDTANFKYNLPISGSGVSVRIPNAEGGAQQAALAGLILTQANQGTDDRVDSDATLNGSDAEIPVTTSAGTIDHSFDFGFAPDDWDLALRKNGPVQHVAAGSSVRFMIDIINQGVGPVDNIEIVDYVPLNLSVNDANWTPTTQTGPGTVTRMLTAGNGLPDRGLWPGESVSIDINMDVAGGLADGTVIVNKAEIANMTALDGSAIEDIDSSPDSTDGETNVKDDLITEDGKNNAGDDEDDHDPAQITMTAQTDVYDLALRKRLAVGQPNVVNEGEDVLFTIEIFNQGTALATSITLVDRYPLDFTLSPNDSNWTDQGNDTATTTLASSLLPGESTAVDILLRAGATLGTVQNFAEIQSDDGDDVDSQPEGDENDTSGDALIDDAIGDDGTLDEDDHDVAEVTVRRFDLALRKQLATGQASTVAKGADVTYVIDVFNQGSVPVYDVRVVDYLTDTLALSENDDNNWVLADTNQLVNTITGPISPTESARLTITLRISDSASLGTLDNYAEIYAASDTPAGPATPDADSAPDLINGNDLLVDDQITEDSTTDQDDHDIASVTIESFDLALTKVIQSDSGAAGSGGDPNDGQVGVGEQITFTLTVHNQGLVNAYDVRVTDTSPQGVIVDDSDLSFNIIKGWEVDSETVAHYVFPGPIVPNASASIDIIMYVVPPTSPFYPVGGYPATPQTNWAEISSASNEPDGPPVVDEDSVPDTDTTNDDTVKDDVINEDWKADPANNDQDDHDPAEFTIVPSFDLAVIKYPLVAAVGQQELPVVEAGQRITYEYVIYNQGIEIAQDITLIEHVPEGLILDDANWTPNNVVGPGIARRTHTVNLVSGDAYTDTVRFQVNSNVTSGKVYTNIIEIESSTGPGGDPNVIDIDSIPDSDGFNEIVIKDDFLTDNFLSDPTLFDEDDHDPAAVMMMATSSFTLTKYLNTAPTMTVGTLISFTIRITNSGGVTITTLPLTDTFDSTYLAFNAVADALGPNPATTINNDSIFWSDATDYDGNDGELAPSEVLDIIVVFDTTLETTEAGGGSDLTCNEAAGYTFNRATVMELDVCVDVPIAPAEPKLTLGDFIWHDIDNDGTQDANELGINSVVVNLYEVAGSGNIFITTTTTAISNTVDGFYQFDVSSNKDYLVEVASSNFDPGGPLANFVLGQNQPNITDDADPDRTAINVTVNDDTLDFGFYCEFDLALDKKLATGQQATIAPGDNVTFTITIYNQGAVTATDITIADYVPTDFTVANGDWSATSGTVTQALATTLTPSGTANAMTTVDIVLTAGATLSGTYTNTAEIITYTTSVIDGNGNSLPDVDSTPDDTDGNGSPGQDGESTDMIDDEIGEDGKNGGDEDDHDPATITVIPTATAPSIAVDKQFNGTGDYRVNETISFTIRITNTGDAIITSLPLEDRYSHAFIMYVSANPAPNTTADGILTWADVLSSVNDLDGLGLGESISVVVIFRTEADTTLLPAIVPCTQAGHAPNVARSVGAMAGADTVMEDADDSSCDSVQIHNPTAVKLAERSISQTPEGVMVRWSTVSENEIVGFNIWHASGVAAEMRSGEMIVASNAGQSNGASYQWLDGGVTLSQGDVYVLEILRNNGTSERTVIDVMRDEQIFLPFVSR